MGLSVLIAYWILTVSCLMTLCYANTQTGFPPCVLVATVIIFMVLLLYPHFDSNSEGSLYVS